MIADAVRNTGRLIVDFIDDVSGEVRERLYLDNEVVQSGLDHIAACANGEVQNVMSHMAIGTSPGAVAANQTTLLAEITRVGLESRNRSGSTTTYVANFPAGVATGTVAELGIFNAASGGTMLNRVAFTPQTKESYTSIRVSWVVTQSI